MIPLRHAKWTYAWTLALLFYYLSTMSLGLSLYDSPALALVGEQLGLSHPIGQPLHTILAFVGSSFANIVGMEPLIATNALSALSGALILPSVCSIGENLIEGRTTRHSAGLWLAPVVALGGTHIALWEPATRIEVYALATCLGFWGVARLVHAFESPENDAPNMWLTGLLFGLSAASHAHVALALAIACTPRCILAVIRREAPPSAIEKVVGGGLLGLLVYLYVPLIALLRDDAIIWGRPDDWESLKHYFSGADYQVNRQITLALFTDHLKQWLIWSTEKGHLFFLLLGFVGYGHFARRRGVGRFFFFAVLAYLLGLVVANAIFAPDILDYLEYLMPSFWIAALGLGLLAVYAANKHPLWASIVAGITIGLVFFSSPSPLSRTRHLDNATRELAHAALLDAPPNTILIVAHDHWAASLMYAQERDHIREDVTVLPYGLSSSAWVWEHLYKRHPGLHPVAIGGEADRNIRIRNFASANSDRPLQVESTSLAQTIGLSGCLGRFFIDIKKRCDPIPYPSPIEFAVQELHSRLGNGSPGTDPMLTLIALHRGIDRARVGQPRAAIKSLLLTTPDRWQPQTDELDTVPQRMAPMRVTLPPFTQPVALGSVGRNLYMASAISNALNANILASRLQSYSAETGLLEAQTQ